MDDPLLTAVAGALREHGVTDPKAVLAAADAAPRKSGTATVPTGGLL